MAVPDATGDVPPEILSQSAAPPNVSVRIYSPEMSLRSHVTFYYFVDASAPFTDFLYPEWGNVRLGLTGDWRVRLADRYPAQPQKAALFGPTDRCAEVVAGPGRMVGFGMSPLGWHRLFGDASSMANRIADLGLLLGVQGSDLIAQFLTDDDDAQGVARWDALLRNVLAGRPPDDPQAIAVDRACRTNPESIPAFAQAAGISVRSLHRVCLRIFGFPPKRLLRRQRFLDTLGHVRSAVRDPLVPSLGSQYYDLPQFYRDFRDFMGMSARDYFASPRALMGPAAEAQRAAEITLSFELPPLPPLAPQ